MEPSQKRPLVAMVASLKTMVFFDISGTGHDNTENVMSTPMSLCTLVHFGVLNIFTYGAIAKVSLSRHGGQFTEQGILQNMS